MIEFGRSLHRKSGCRAVWKKSFVSWVIETPNFIVRSRLQARSPFVSPCNLAFSFNRNQTRSLPPLPNHRQKVSWVSRAAGNGMMRSRRQFCDLFLLSYSASRLDEVSGGRSGRGRGKRKSQLCHRNFPLPYKGMLFTIDPFAKRLMQENRALEWNEILRLISPPASPTPPASCLFDSSCC